MYVTNGRCWIEHMLQSFRGIWRLAVQVLLEQTVSSISEIGLQCTRARDWRVHPGRLTRIMEFTFFRILECIDTLKHLM